MDAVSAEGRAVEVANASSTERLEKLLVASKAVASFQDAAFLAASLPEVLAGVLQFHCISIHLLNPATRQATILPRPPEPEGEPGTPQPVYRFEDWPLSWVWSHQKVLTGMLAECRAHYPAVARLPWYQQDGVYCMVPLTSRQRCLGGLEIISRQSAPLTSEDLYVIQTIAFAVAETVERINTMTQARLEQQKLQRDRESDHILVEVTNEVITYLDLQKLVAEVSRSLSSYFGVEFVCMELKVPEPEPEYPGEAREAASTLRYVNAEASQGMHNIKAMEEPPLSVVFDRKTVFMADAEELQRMASHSQFAAFLVAHGTQALCALPLISGTNVFGVLTLARTQRAAFTNDEVTLLQAVADRVAMGVNNALAYLQISRLKDKLTREKLYLQEEIGEAGNFGAIIGQSTGLKRVLEQARMVADSDCTVLIMGETGTGKELVARAIHNMSRRKAHTMVKVNCAAIPAGVFESDLFGHEKGAFTGADSAKPGRFEFANHSTLLLDEIGEIPMDIQPKLLRALQEREVDRVGGRAGIPVDVRVLAATNCDLPQMVRERRYRSDLYYRLSVFPIIIPPLRDRQEDIPALVRYFTQKYAERLNKTVESISSETMKGLSRLPWPGNVRELENAIERAVILCKGPVLHVPISEILYTDAYNSPEAKPNIPLHPVLTPAIPAVPSASSFSPADDVSDSKMRARILQALFEANGVVGGSNGAAARLGLKRTTLISRMKKLGLDAKLLGGSSLRA